MKITKRQLKSLIKSIINEHVIKMKKQFIKNI